MYSIIWMKHRAEIARESPDLKNGDEVVRYARAKVKMGVAHMAGHKPDEFAVVDETGHEIARQHLQHL